MNDDKMNCYETSDLNMFTRFEIQNGISYILPYSGMLYAHLSAPAHHASEMLILMYVTHTVIISGVKLSLLLLIFQKQRAETIRIGGDQSGGVNTVTVCDITVIEGCLKKENTNE